MSSAGVPHRPSTRPTVRRPSASHPPFRRVRPRAHSRSGPSWVLRGLLIVAVLTLLVGVTAVGATSFVGFQVVHRLLRGEAAEGVFQSVTDGVQFLLFGVVLFGIGLLGEYIGRIYQEVLKRPRFIIGAVLEDLHTSDDGSARDELAARRVR